ncbi:FAD-dependent monooxygenase [Saccharopolyspora flava]|uniref:2-polyprenyl-6-methoxyphenol hydroxylase n=1 Tax=Saccharopolyspora flava TaxID=95161 RepID=A0A1I6PBS6_9PSEU|nr:FAD-dependent monooxygenase [Saccharopolyspora flava]SFS37657.1 2-polyprenyl-6-methoxyphenol hydroxylase [Saccharopolyspora flava]
MAKTVLISGASIAGPALAFWLHKWGFRPTVVERAPGVRDGGYAIDVRGAAVEVADRMGILEEVRAAHTGMRGLSLISADGRSFADIDMSQLGSEDADVELMRGTLARLIHERTDGIEYLFGDSIVDLTERPGGVEVTFEHHPPREFDLVVGADGLHSNVRRLAFGPEGNFRRHLGYHVSIFSTENALGLDRWTALFNEPGRMAGSYRAKTDRGAKGILSFTSPELTFDPRDAAGQLALLDEAFSGMGGIVPQLLSAAREAPDFYFDSVSQIRLDRWSRERVVLLGDAGYCPSPLSGQGSSLALVGACVLAAELRDSEGNHSLAFDRYENRMRDFVRRNQKLAPDGAKILIPKTRTSLHLRNGLLRLAPHLPGAITFSKKTRTAANAIDLPPRGVSGRSDPTSQHR